MWRRLLLEGYANAFVTQPLMRYRHGGGANLSSSPTMSLAGQAYAAKLASAHPQYSSAIAHRFARNAITSAIMHSLRRLDLIRLRRALRDARHHLSVLSVRHYPRLLADVMRWIFWRTTRVLSGRAMGQAIRRILWSFMPDRHLVATIAVRLTVSASCYIAYRMSLGVVPGLVSSGLRFVSQMTLFMAIWGTLSHAEGVFTGHLVKLASRSVAWLKRRATAGSVSV
jgi:hypothetical protein